MVFTTLAHALRACRRFRRDEAWAGTIYRAERVAGGFIVRALKRNAVTGELWMYSRVTGGGASKPRPVKTPQVARVQGEIVATLRTLRSAFYGSSEEELIDLLGPERARALVDALDEFDGLPNENALA